MLTQLYLKPGEHQTTLKAGTVVWFNGGEYTLPADVTITIKGKGPDGQRRAVTDKGTTLFWVKSN